MHNTCSLALPLCWHVQVQDGLGPHNVLGVIPQALTPREISSELIGDTKIVGDMHERKVARAMTGFRCCTSNWSKGSSDAALVMMMQCL